MLGIRVVGVYAKRLLVRLYRFLKVGRVEEDIAQVERRTLRQIRIGYRERLLVALLGSSIPLLTIVCVPGVVDRLS